MTGSRLGTSVPARAPTEPGRGPFTIELGVPRATATAAGHHHRRGGSRTIVVGVFRMRVASHFGGPEAGYDTWPYAGTAAEALDQLDSAYAAWLAGVAGPARGEAGARPGPAGPPRAPYAELPLADLVTHIHREVIHHGAEVCLLRDRLRPPLRLIGRAVRPPGRRSPGAWRSSP